jgi:hypothetical protein
MGPSVFPEQAGETSVVPGKVCTQRIIDSTVSCMHAFVHHCSTTTWHIAWMDALHCIAHTRAEEATCMEIKYLFGEKQHGINSCEKKRYHLSA